jgi:ribosomal protein S12 methylthiotransferase
MPKKEKIFLISLGCAKNLVDSEHMLGMLDASGFTITEQAEEADVIIVNTCGFLQTAVEESIDVIFETARLKTTGKLKHLIVAGCFVQRYGYKLQQEIPEVDAWIGTGELDKVVEAVAHMGSGAGSFFIGRPTLLPDHRSPRIQTTPFYTSYLRIGEGCSHRCSYCIIPNLRGSFRSREIESVLIEAREMVSRGVKEINLIAQDTTYYGKDLKTGPFLEDLLEKMVLIDGIAWIRLLYLHPHGITERLLDLMESQAIIAPYLDLPFQHSSPELLRSMGRPRSQEAPMELIARIRRRKREMSIRTTLMVGFPGETESMFKQMREFIETAEFEHLGVFVYSAEKGTPAARFKPVVDHDIAENRRAEIMDVQARISKRNNRKMIGKVFPVLVEGPYSETELLLCGRTAGMAPEVDRRVLINKGEGIVGEIMPVKITEAHDYDVVGEIV